MRKSPSTSIGSTSRPLLLASSCGSGCGCGGDCCAALVLACSPPRDGGGRGESDKPPRKKTISHAATASSLVAAAIFLVSLLPTRSLAYCPSTPADPSRSGYPSSSTFSGTNPRRVPSFGVARHPGVESAKSMRLFERKRRRWSSSSPPSPSTPSTTSVLEGEDAAASAGETREDSQQGGSDAAAAEGEEDSRVWNWNASGSFGSLLMQLQKEEEAMIASNGTLLEEVAMVGGAVDLDHYDPAAKDRKDGGKGKDMLVVDRDPPAPSAIVPPADERGEQDRRLIPQKGEPKRSIIPRLDWETAKELDEAVVELAASPETLREQVKVLPLDPLYVQQLQDQTQKDDLAVEEDPLLKLSQPEHYRYRLGKNLRYLAVNIASSIESIGQWRLFCQNGGGLYPLLETVRQGATNLHHTGGSSAAGAGTTANLSLQEAAEMAPPNAAVWGYDGSWHHTNGDSYNFSPEYNTQHHQQLEETFLQASNACRALRDICAISPEAAAVLTDGILRANQAWEGGLFRDLCTFLKYANEFTATASPPEGGGYDVEDENSQHAGFRTRWRQRQDTRLRCKLYVTQLLLAMTVASDDAVAAIRSTKGLDAALLECSSYARKEQTRRWLRYPGELIKYFWRLSKKQRLRLFKVLRRRSGVSSFSSRIMKRSRRLRRFRRPFLEAANVASDLNGQVQKTSNQVLAAIGYNRWIPKQPGQKGLRILCLDGGGSRGMTAVTAVKQLMDYVGDGMQVADCFDLVAGTSTGGIISFLTGLRGETAALAVQRYNLLIRQIFVKSALSTPRMVFTTATYDESYFMKILDNILGDDTMLDSRADPSTPYVFCVTSKMSSTPTHVALFRNYNYASGELSDHFTLDPSQAREELDLPLDLEHELIRSGDYNRTRIARAAPGLKVSDGSRHPGSFRVLQRYALRASTAAPTVFKPVMMGGEMYCDGGIVASNPTAVAIHEARTLFPDVPIELVVSLGTGGFTEQKTSGRFGWDAIIGQIVGSATDGEQIHHILEDVLGDPDGVGLSSSVSKTRYYRFNPLLGPPDEFPIDVTDPEKLAQLKQITIDYMSEPAQQAKMESIADVVKGRPKWRKWISRR